MVSITDNSYAQLPVQCTYIREFVLRRYLHITNMDGYILIPTMFTFYGWKLYYDRMIKTNCECVKDIFTRHSMVKYTYAKTSYLNKLYLSLFTKNCFPIFRYNNVHT